MRFEAAIHKRVLVVGLDRITLATKPNGFGAVRSRVSTYHRITTRSSQLRDRVAEEVGEHA